MEDDELDLDGDGEADVRIPGLPPMLRPDSEVSEQSDVRARVSAQMPPGSSNLSPMGQIEHLGYALHSDTARVGWRRTVVRGWAWLYLVGPVFFMLVVGLIQLAR